MDFTFINYDTTGWSYDHFMMWDDPAAKNGKHLWCGSDCTRHTLYVKSASKQLVRIGGHAYRFYTYADAKGQCPVRTADAQLEDADIDTFFQVFDANNDANVIVNERD